jgi:cell shape-determining protein MreC
VTSQNLVVGLSLVVDVLLIIVLYHLLFLMVDLRKIFQRVESLTEELESVILKPLSLTDKAFQWILHFLEAEKAIPSKNKGKGTSKRKK